MTLRGTYIAHITRKEFLEVTVTDATETDVWKAIDLGLVSVGITRPEYDAMSEEERAKFLAKIALSAGLDYIELVGELVSSPICYFEG